MTRRREIVRPGKSRHIWNIRASPKIHGSSATITPGLPAEMAGARLARPLYRIGRQVSSCHYTDHRVRHNELERSIALFGQFLCQDRCHGEANDMMHGIEVDPVIHHHPRAKPPSSDAKGRPPCGATTRGLCTTLRINTYGSRRFPWVGLKIVDHKPFVDRRAMPSSHCHRIIVRSVWVR